MPLSFRHLTSAAQISRADMDVLANHAEEMEKVIVAGGDDRLKGKILASLFYEPSTRTRLSFETAMMRLGGQVVTADGFQFSSLYKGESLEDSIKVIAQYTDILCMRHPEEGSADRAAAVSSVPFVNAGDGPGQHPTQALLDLYTIRKECGRVEGLRIAMVGDPKNSRTIHSLSLLLSLYPGIFITFVGPESLRVPGKVTTHLKAKNIEFAESHMLEDALDADVLYMTRVQKERFADMDEYERLKNAFILTADHLAGKSVKVMDPLPRVGDVDLRIDDLPNAAYFRQAKNGVPMRMALLDLLLSTV